MMNYMWSCRVVDHSIALNNIFTKTSGIILLFVSYQQVGYNKTDVAYYISNGGIQYLNMYLILKPRNHTSNKLPQLYLYIYKPLNYFYFKGTIIIKSIVIELHINVKNLIIYYYPLHSFHANVFEVFVEYLVWSSPTTYMIDSTT